MSDAVWTREDAIALCVVIESVCPQYGCHVALTGGLLYRMGSRKDADVLLYRIRQVEEIDLQGLFVALRPLGLECLAVQKKWCLKATYQGKPIDIFLPDYGGEYVRSGRA